MFTPNRILSLNGITLKFVPSKKLIVSLYPSTFDMHDILFIKPKSWCNIIQHMVPATMQLLIAIPA